MTDQPVKESDPAPEEYSQLRAEMTQLLASGRTAWLAVATIYTVAGASLVGGLVTLYHSNQSGFYGVMSQGGLVMVSIVLLILQIAVNNLAHGWMTEAYYIGSYIEVFHEQQNPSRFQWITRHRDEKKPEALKGISDPPVLGYSGHSIVFLFLGLLPAVVNAVVWFERPVAVRSCLSIFSFVVLILVLLWYVRQYNSLKKSGAERNRLTQEWKTEWNRIHGSTRSES